MSSNMPYESVDFRYLLLEYYKKLGLSESEVSVILMINHLLNQKNEWITPDMLSVKMTFKSAELDKIMTSLLGRKFLEYVEILDGPSPKWVTSLEPLSKALWQQFSLDVTRNNQNRLSATREKTLSELYAYFEKRWSRPLSPLDKDMLNAFLDDGYRAEQIRLALEEAHNDGKKTMKSVGKRLRMQRAGEDIGKEGITAVSEIWDKDIEETIEIARTKWIDDVEN
mgnify:CR=1 FL=1